MDELLSVALVSGISVLAASAMGFGHGGSMSLPFALALFALCIAGYFAILSFMKSGMSRMTAAGAYFVLVFAAYIAAFLSFGALSMLTPMSFIPLLLSAAPALPVAAKEVIV